MKFATPLLSLAVTTSGEEDYAHPIAIALGGILLVVFFIWVYLRQAEPRPLWPWQRAAPSVSILMVWLFIGAIAGLALWLFVSFIRWVWMHPLF